MDVSRLASAKFVQRGATEAERLRDEATSWSRQGCIWPLSQHPKHFELGCILNAAVTDALEPHFIGALAFHHAGLWECDLKDNSLIWSGGAYDIFGLQRGSAIAREQILAHYTEHSRAKLERLRAHAIRNRQGFTVDLEIRAAAVGDSRCVRVIGAPVCERDAVVRLHGVKLVVRA